MNLLFWAITLGTFGKVILGFAVYRVHHKIFREHRIDKKVLASIVAERYFTLAGILLIALGYLLEIQFYRSMELLNCVGVECAALIGKAF